MSYALPYTPGTRIPRLLGIKNYFAMYQSLTHTCIRVELASRSLLGVRNGLKNYLAMNKCLTRSGIRVEVASPTVLVLGII